MKLPGQVLISQGPTRGLSKVKLNYVKVYNNLFQVNTINKNIMQVDSTSCVITQSKMICENTDICHK